MLIETISLWAMSGLLLFAHKAILLGALAGAIPIAINRGARSGPGLMSRVMWWIGVLAFIPAICVLLIAGLSKLVWIEFLLQPPTHDLWAWGIAAGLSVISALAFMRWGAQLLDRLKSRFTKSSDLERNRKTDVRDIHQFLPAEIGGFNPLKQIKPDVGMFIGLDEQKTPVYLPYETWQISHALLTGRTRSGKGVAAQILLSQAIRRGEFVVVLDPKVDNWMPHIFAVEAETAGVPYHYLDLRQSAHAQINPFIGCDLETLENMLVGGFALTEKGEAADFYRLADRKAARQCAAWLVAHPGSTARDVLLALGDNWADAAPAFHSYLMEMAELAPVNRQASGIDVAALEQSGGMLYVVGDMINPRIIRMQRMILLRLLFLAKNRPYLEQPPRTITVLADEFKVHISRPFIAALGASAGWGLHCILAFQSLQDLADCPADLDKDAVRGSVMENCAIQLSYAIKDPETAEWLAASTGTVLVDDESRRVSRNIALSETVEHERTLRQAERYLIDTNMFMNLPKGCGVLTTPGELARFCYTSPVLANRSEGAITPTTPPLSETQAPATSLATAALDIPAQSKPKNDLL
jgi:hypothetical protein